MGCERRMVSVGLLVELFLGRIEIGWDIYISGRLQEELVVGSML